MERKIFFISTVLIFAVLLAACGGAAMPTPTPAPTKASPPTPAPSFAPKSSDTKFATKSNEGGSVTVTVTPIALIIGEPIAFEIAMNTHSVDLSDDITKIVILRDDAGKEYSPTAWEGQEPGGHHRGGILKFTALATKTKFVELVIKGLAKVPERVFQWQVP